MFVHHRASTRRGLQFASAATSSGAAPETQLRAAAGFGKLIAMGILRLDDCLPLLIEAAQGAGCDCGLGSLARCEMVWAVRDSAAAWEITRTKAERAIRKRLAPLLQARVPSGMLLRAAHDENARWDDPLLHREVVAIVHEEAAWWLRTRTGRRRHG